MPLTQSDILRYTRQLPVIGLEGQSRLACAKILCVGAGGLGAAVLQYLAACGVGTIGIIDGDTVELSNLQRQVIFHETDCGQNKAECAKNHLQALNATIGYHVYPQFLTLDNADLCEQYDLIVDCSDNYATRYLINDLCIRYNKPLISASIYQFEGQLGVFNYNDGPCYRCLYESPPPEDLTPNCAVAGVLGVLPGVMGCLQATEVIKIILRKPKILSATLCLYDALQAQTKTFSIAKNPACPACVQHNPLSIFIPEQLPQQSEIDEITPQQLNEWINSGQQILLLDVRQAYEREICHIGGLHIPMPELARRHSEIAKEQPIIVYCKSGKRSQRAVYLLKKQGFKKLLSLKGGILAWHRDVDARLRIY